jgi:uncharacterized protein involved in exopolysaccharide biosynthesis
MGMAQVSPEHYLRLILHRKWLVVGNFVLVSAGTYIVSSRLTDIYTSSTLILVDPQKVPESYVKSTVTGDLRNRLGTLQQQILSATRLQKIIDTLNLYPTQRKSLAREDVIAMMQKDVSVSIVSNYGGSQDLEAFRIGFRGTEARLVAQVANDLATQFIDENLKAREQQSTGTTEFLQNQLQESKKILEGQEGRLKEFKLKHLGEMPEQQSANLQILGQLQSSCNWRARRWQGGAAEEHDQVLMPKQLLWWISTIRTRVFPGCWLRGEGGKGVALVLSSSAHVAAALWRAASGYTEAKASDRR